MPASLRRNGVQGTELRCRHRIGSQLNLSTKEVARLVDRSTRAVEKHLTSAYRKLGVQQHKDKRQEAVRIARQKHLLPSPDATGGIT